MGGAESGSSSVVGVAEEISCGYAVGRRGLLCVLLFSGATRVVFHRHVLSGVGNVQTLQGSCCYMYCLGGSKGNQRTCLQWCPRGVCRVRKLHSLHHGDGRPVGRTHRVVDRRAACKSTRPGCLHRFVVSPRCRGTALGRGSGGSGGGLCLSQASCPPLSPPTSGGRHGGVPRATGVGSRHTGTPECCWSTAPLLRFWC